MNKKILYSVIILLLLLIFSFLFSIFKWDVISNNIRNTSPGNKDLENWKKEQIENYKYWVNHEFTNWKIVNIDIEAQEKEMGLIPWIKTKMYTYNNDWSIKPLIITVNKWDKVVVNFKNSLNETSTIHWHWVRVPNMQDWVPWVTQDPVSAWWDYKYEFVANDAWTFLFHPHANHSQQIWKWLYWVLIVKDKDEPKYDQELTWVLKDYRVWNDWKLTNDFWNMHDAVHGWRLWNIITINNIVNFAEELNAWETVRLRLANLSNARIYNLDFSWINTKIIWLDDSLVKEAKEIKTLEISPWERYELELKVPNDKNLITLYDNYFAWIKTPIINLNIEDNNEKYNEVKTPTRDIPNWTNIKYNTPDVVIDLWWMWVMWWDKMMWMMWNRWWTINDWIFPETNEEIKLEMWKMYIVRMMNNSLRDHPMHLHWDFFQVISVNWMKWELIWFKDTINVKPKEYVDVAIIPTNPWTWAFHCHILEHADLWMFTTIEIK